MYAFLLEAGYQYFSHPITEFVPELAALASWQSGNAITNVAWGDVTIGDLASHLAGLHLIVSIVNQTVENVLMEG